MLFFIFFSCEHGCVLVKFSDPVFMLDYLETSYENGNFRKAASVFKEETLLIVGYENYEGTEEIELFWTDLFSLSPNMSYVINQTEKEESTLFGTFDMETGGVFEFDITYEPIANLITHAILIPSNINYIYLISILWTL